MKKIIKYLNRFLATGLFVGEIPGAPGTYGSILGMVLLIYLPILNDVYFIIPFILLATFISYFDELYTGIEDNPKVVIDEVSGIFITFISISSKPVLLISGFLLFRLFDITKPYLIDKVQKYPFGIGVMADDILAGLLSNLLLRIILIIV